MAGQLAKQESSNIAKYQPFQGMNVFDDMEKMFEDLSAGNWLQPFRWRTPFMSQVAANLETAIPKVDVIERDNEILIKATLPGVEKKDIDISMTKNTVTIKGTTKHEEKEEEGNYCRHEISAGSYMRSLTLPAEVDDTKAKAKYKDGLLELTVPKVEVSQRHSVKVE